MKYTCNTQGCAKEHIVYDTGIATGGIVPDCNGCGETCAIVPDPEATPEPEISPDIYGALTPHIEELKGDSEVLSALSSMYRAIKASAALSPLQVRIIMRELITDYLAECGAHD